MFSPFRLSELKPNVRGDRASTRRDTLHGRSRGQKMQAGGERGPELEGKAQKASTTSIPSQQ